jgi:hypothetical protein
LITINLKKYSKVWYPLAQVTKVNNKYKVITDMAVSNQYQRSKIFEPDDRLNKFLVSNLNISPSVSPKPNSQMSTSMSI